jgi:hypothetical protein
MKTKTVGFFAAIAMVAAFATQDSISFERKYKEGDKDKYNVSMNVNGDMGEVQITMAIAQTVKKVYPDGGADIESQSSDMKIKFNGQEMNAGNRPMPAITERFDKYGIPSGKSSGGNGANMNFLRFASALPSQGIKVGQTIAIDRKDPENPKNTVKGTMTLDSIANGIAKLIVNCDVTSDATTTPMKIALTSNVEVSNSKPKRVEGTISNLPAQQGMNIKAIQFVMERAN